MISYSELAKCKGHLPTVAANLDKHIPEPGKGASNLTLQRLVVVHLGKTELLAIDKNFFGGMAHLATKMHAVGG